MNQEEIKKIRDQEEQHYRTLHFGMYILDELTKNNLDFYFKGGTSLHLMIKQMTRISQDIDIAVNNKEVISEIANTLKKIGFIIEEHIEEPSTYAKSFRISYQELFVMFDISIYTEWKKIELTYKNDKTMTTSDQNFDFQFKFFPIEITVLEKILALQIRSFKLISDNTDDDTKRIFRHFLDLYHLNKLNKLEFLKNTSLVNYIFTLAFKNEVNPDKLNSFSEITDFNIFQVEYLEKMRKQYDKWGGDSYSDSKQNPDWSNIMEFITEELKEKLTGIKLT